MEKIILGILLALIPTQLGKHWWPDFSMIGGVRVDYLSPTLYLIDVVWLVWLGVRMYGGEKNKLVPKWWWMGLALINVAVAQNKWVAGMVWLRWWQWWTVIVWLAQNKEWAKKTMIRIIPFWILIEAGLSLAQVAGGGNVGGIWWWLGERRFSLGGIGIAQMMVDGEGWVRAYGTFSHPNSLAGFALMVGWWSFERLRTDIKGWIRAVWWAVMFGAGMIIGLAGSRVVWALGVVGLGAWLVSLKSIKRKIGIMAIAAGGVVMLLGVVSREYEIKSWAGSLKSETVRERVMLLAQSWEMGKDNWIAGVGLNNWLVKQTSYEKLGEKKWRQPVHNVVMLWWNETGIIGLIMAGGLVVSEIRKKRLKVIAGFLLILIITGGVDHYWLTLPQTRWIWGVIWAII